MSIENMLAGVNLAQIPFTRADSFGEEPTYVDPDCFVYVAYVTYDKVGRITGGGEGTKAGLKLGRLMNNDRNVAGSGQPATHYVDLSNGVPTLRERPIFPRSFDKSNVPANAETAIKALPASTITYFGPETGTHTHLGGDLSVGFAAPGVYRLDVDPFPYRSFQHTLTVTA